MAVPNTTTFTLQNVVDEVNPTTDDLVDCFADANPFYFNPSYEGSKDNLLNFRDYGVHHSKTLTALPTSLTWLWNDFRLLKTVNVTIFPDVTFSAILTGLNADKFQIMLVDNTNDLVTVRNNEQNTSAYDNVAMLEISASGYPTAYVTLLQYGSM